MTFTRLDRELVRLRERFLGDVVTPGDEAYEAARRVWNGSIDRRPRLIVRCRTVDDVLAVVEIARSTDLLAAVRGAGHHIAGFSTCDDGIVIDLSLMKDISVDPRGGKARAQGGVVWGELDRATQDFGLAVTGVALLSEVRITGEAAGLAFSLANCGLFTLYIVVGHRIAADGGSAGIDRLALAMVLAAVAISPAAMDRAIVAFTHPLLLGAGCGVGICSSVIPYVTDQLAMARLSRARKRLRECVRARMKGGSE